MSFWRKVKHGLFIGASFAGAFLSFPLLLRRLRKQKRDDEVIIALFPHFGDVVYGMLYAEQYHKETGTKVSVYCGDNVAHMMKKYPFVDRVITYRKNSLEQFRVILFSPLRYATIKKENYDGIIATVPPKHHFRGRAVVEVYRDLIYKVQEDKMALFIPDTVPITSIPDFESKKDRIIVINPYSFSHGYNRELFEKLVVALRGKGYIVYTNAVAKFGQQPIKGSLPLDCSVEELYAIVNKIPLFISVRSGILDVMVSGQGNLFALHFKRNHWMRTYFPLRDLRPNNVYDAVWFKKADTPRVIHRIETVLQEIK